MCPSCSSTDAETMSAMGKDSEAGKCIGGAVRRTASCFLGFAQNTRRPAGGGPAGFALRRQRDEEKLRRSVKQEERRCRRFRLAARLGAYGSSVPSDKSYNRVTYSAAQGSLPRFTFSSQADGIGSNSLAPPPCRPPSCLPAPRQPRIITGKWTVIYTTVTNRMGEP